uniref:Uncharacterized protein n=1 Tax=Acrobeloides nanus TaxID=290746 RepID=A0A914D623_9BILA
MPSSYLDSAYISIFRYPYLKYNNSISNSTELIVFDALALVPNFLNYEWVEAIFPIYDACAQVYAVVGTQTGKYYDSCVAASIIEYCRLKNYDENVVETMLNFSYIYDQLGFDNLYILIPFGVIGVVVSIFVMILVLFKKSDQRTSLDILCAIIAFVDLIFILNVLILEGGYFILYEHEIVTASHLLEFLGHELSYTIFFIHLITSMTSTVIGTVKSLNQMTALYFPVFYRCFTSSESKIRIQNQIPDSKSRILIQNPNPEFGFKIQNSDSESKSRILVPKKYLQSRIIL